MIASDTNPDEGPAAQARTLLTKPARETGKERPTQKGQHAQTATEGPTSTTSNKRNSPLANARAGVTQKT